MPYTSQDTEASAKNTGIIAINQSLLDLSISQSGRLVPLRFRIYIRKIEVYLCAPPLLFCRPPPQPNCLAQTSSTGAYAHIRYLETACSMSGISLLPIHDKLPLILHEPQSTLGKCEAVKVHRVFPSTC